MELVIPARKRAFSYAWNSLLCMANGEWELSLFLIYESGYEFLELKVRIRHIYFFGELLKLDNMSEFIFIFSNDTNILITNAQSETFYSQITGAQCRHYVDVYHINKGISTHECTCNLGLRVTSHVCALFLQDFSQKKLQWLYCSLWIIRCNVIVEGKFIGKNNVFTFEACLNCKMQDNFIHFFKEKSVLWSAHFLLALCNMTKKMCKQNVIILTWKKNALHVSNKKYWKIQGMMLFVTLDPQFRKKLRADRS